MELFSMVFNLYVSSKINKKDFRKKYKVEECYFVTEDDLFLNQLNNEYQDFIFLQDLERIVSRTMKSKRFSSIFLNVTEKHKNLIAETTYNFFNSEDIKISSV